MTVSTNLSYSKWLIHVAGETYKWSANQAFHFVSNNLYKTSFWKNLARNFGVNRALQLGVEGSSLLKARLWADLGAEINDDLFLTSIKKGDLEMVRLLVACGANLNPKIEPWELRDLPIEVAIKQKNDEMVKLLVCLGSNLNPIMYSGMSCLIEIAANQNDPKMMRLLISLGAQCESLDSLMIDAIEKGFNSVLELLGELKANFNQELSTIDNLTPLEYAVDLGNALTVRTLIKWGADPNRINFYGLSVFTLALQKHNEQIISAFKEAGSNEELANQLLCTKQLALVWGLSGEMPIEVEKGVQRNIMLSGAIGNMGFDMIEQCLPEFLTENQVLFASTKKEKFLESFNKSIATLQMTESEVLQTVKAGEVAFISGGFRGHRVIYILCHDRLLVCNRGPGRDSEAIITFELNSEDINEKLVKHLNKIYWNLEAYDYFIKSLKSKFKRVPSNILMKDQKSPNCVLASSKIAFFGFLTFYFDNVKTLEIYKSFSFFMRSFYYKKYISTVSKPHKEIKEAITQKVKAKIDLDKSIQLKYSVYME